MAKPTEEELREAILRIHRIYYKACLDGDTEESLEFHRQLEILFNYAGIEETLIKNNIN